MVSVVDGKGYFGSHTEIAHAQPGQEFLIWNGFCNIRTSVVERQDTKSEVDSGFIQADIRVRSFLINLFSDHPIDSDVNFYALKKSVEKPLEYSDGKLVDALELPAAMFDAKVRIFVFYSSATVHADPAGVPFCEDFSRSATNQLGLRKLIIEKLSENLRADDPGWQIAQLRYFNPVGAHESGLIGEDPKNIPGNFIALIAQAAIGERGVLDKQGIEYPAPYGCARRLPCGAFGQRPWRGARLFEKAEKHWPRRYRHNSLSHQISPRFLISRSLG